MAQNPGSKIYFALTGSGVFSATSDFMAAATPPS
jgi:hypothetical protein